MLHCWKSCLRGTEGKLAAVDSVELEGPHCKLVNANAKAKQLAMCVCRPA